MNKIIKLDGRRTHWVEGGLDESNKRFSIIWYKMSDSRMKKAVS